MELSGRRGSLPCLLRWPPRHDWQKVEVTSLSRLGDAQPGDIVIERVRCMRCGKERVR
jgi:hypothetical protein